MVTSTLRIIKSQDKAYMLTDEGMFTLTERDHKIGITGASYRVLNLCKPSLTKSVVRRIFKDRKGRTRQYSFAYDERDNFLRIGCQTFDNAAVCALKNWLNTQ
jgi:hypothetical protein